MSPPATGKAGDGRVALLVVLLFVALGPPVGALAFGLLITAAAPFIAPDENLGALFLYGVVFLLPLAWMIGGLQAVLTGAATALWSWRFGTAPMRVPLITASIAAAFSVARSGETADVAAILFGAHLAAAAACWLAATRIWGWPAHL